MFHTTIKPEYDVVVVGARIAGASTAMLLARQGLRVLVVDRSRRGADTLSTHALMRPAVYLLNRWGLLDAIRDAGTPPIRTTSFHYGDAAVDIDITPSDGVDALYAPRRTVVDRVLVDAAVVAGADVRFSVSFQGVVRDETGRVCGVRLRTPTETISVRSALVVGADGVYSSVARAIEAPTVLECSYASGVVYAYFEGLDRDRNDWYWRPRVSAGVIPTNDGAACVFSSAPSRRFRERMRHDVQEGFWEVLAEAAPGFADRLRSCPRVSPFRGHPGHVGYMRRATGPGWVLVGDAGYFKDPLTAHGMTDALRDAQLLALVVDQVGTFDLSGYGVLRDRLSADLLGATEEVASFRWDLPSIQSIHRRLSKCMKHELESLQNLLRSEPASEPPIELAS
jgi:2-polyprenyl-6-methoxyphenol hydroxylase-like FAD-dependent oxidoreductase